MNSSTWKTISEQNEITEIICQKGSVIDYATIKGQFSFFSNFEEINNNSRRSKNIKKIGDKRCVLDCLNNK